MTLPLQDLAHVQQHMRAWDKLRGKRIFVTGASGFVGVWLTESLEWANQNLSLDAQLTRVSRTEFPRGAFDYGIHVGRAPDFWTDINLTRRVLEFAGETGVTRLLFTSSGAVYGRLPAGLTHVSEDYLGAPYPHDIHSGYAQAKRAGEFLCAEYASKFSFCAVIARLFAFSGPKLPLDSNFAVGNFVRDALTSKSIRIQGDGSARRSYLYAADLAIWIWTLLTEGENARPYNVGSPDSVSITELAQAVAANTRAATVIETLGREIPGAASVYVPSVDRAYNELGLKPLIALDEGIRRMYEWNLRLKSREMKEETDTPS